MRRHIHMLPAMGGTRVRVTVREIPRPLTSTGRCRAWMEQVHEPFIANDPARCDREWDWQRRIPFIVFGGGFKRRPRLFQLCAVETDLPIGMVALLENERWFADETMSAVYVWYLSAAPRTAFPEYPGLKLVGPAVLDIAVTASLNGQANGRVWLHADPDGGDDLLTWYRKQGMVQVSIDSFPRLPGSVIKPRVNDGRYFFFDEMTSSEFCNALDTYRR